MRDSHSIAAITTRQVRASPRSVWIMAEVTTVGGLTGTGEASLHFAQAEVLDALATSGRRITGLDIHTAIAYLAAQPQSALPQTAARCALDQALHDIEAQRRGTTISKLFCDRPIESVCVYANINRRTLDRSPSGFAASATDAIAAGFHAVKIAPFDATTPQLSATEARPLLRAACDRIAAVRSVLGPKRKLLVDCHWRLAEHMLEAVLEACKEHAVFWLETPFPEDAEHVDAICAATRQASARGILTAGGELKAAGADMDLLIGRRCYDVLMPDMKYVGGYANFMAVSAAASQHDMQVAPHNPTGPVCHAHSVQASAAIRNLLILEMQFDETPLFHEIVNGELALPVAGVVRPPTCPGLGLRLNHSRLNELEAA